MVRQGKTDGGVVAADAVTGEACLLVRRGFTVSLQVLELELQNGDLLKRAEESGYHLIVTTDQNLRYQQNLPG